MQFSLVTVDCRQHDRRTLRQKPFRVAKYIFNYETVSADRIFLDKVLLAGKNLANKVNPGAANDSVRRRDSARILNNCVAGVLSEYLWQRYLNREREVVAVTTFESASNQVDLKILANDKKIEVRSSFPRNGIEFALCSSTHQFDVIGMYSNRYKPGEIQKDYYLRALFHLGVERYWQKDAQTKIPIIEKLTDKMQRDNFAVYLTGGATRSMMYDPDTAVTKNFIPDDETDPARLQTGTNYRVVPFSKALDTVEAGELIKAEE